MESMKKALNDFALENKHQETEKEEILTIDDVQNIFNVSKVTIHKLYIPEHAGSSSYLGKVDPV
jgi:hypothetical protein